MSGSEPKEEFVIVERPRLSAAAILLMILILMQAIAIFAMMSYWARLQNLYHDVTLLRSEIRELRTQIEELNENMRHYRHIDELLQLYIQSLVLKAYKELLPGMSEEDIKKLMEELISERERAINETVSETEEVVIRSGKSG